jgi:hypothetical protein
VILNLSNLTLQHLAWIFALISSAEALYILAMNWRHPTHRWVGLFLMIVAINQAAEGMLFGANALSEAFLPTVLIALSSLMIMPMMGIVTFRLLKPEWLRERWRWAELALWGGVALIILPALIILAEILSRNWFDTEINLYYTGLDPAAYFGGFVNFAKYTGGFISPFIKTLNLLVPFIAILVFVYTRPV